VGWFALTVERRFAADQVERRVREALMLAHHVHPGDSVALGSYNCAEQFSRIHGLFRGIRRFIWLVGTLTLEGGMLGVGNILLIIVKERTKEIGVRRALGATPWNITSLVLAEGLTLTALAGYSGIVAGVLGLEAVSHAVQHFPSAPLTEPAVSLRVALGAALLLMLAGLAASWVPARRALATPPVDALRAE
jgi:putative ABC transport system permease protein